MIYPKLPTQVFDSPAAVVAASPSGWVAVKGTLVKAGVGAKLCSAVMQGAVGCPAQAAVAGLDLSGLFGGDPHARFSGTYLARVVDGSLVDLTSVPVPGCCSM